MAEQKIGMTDVLKAVCAVTGISRNIVLSACQRDSTVAARQLAMLIMFIETDKNRSCIGRFLKCHRSTVYSACDSARARLARCERYRVQRDAVMAKLAQWKKSGDLAYQRENRGNGILSPTAPKPEATKPRRCLMCCETFDSEGPGNRRCKDCKRLLAGRPEMHGGLDENYGAWRGSEGQFPG